MEWNKVALKLDHSSAFVDIDGDCQNDLLIHSSYSIYDTNFNKTVEKNFLEVWRGSLENDKVYYCLNKLSIHEIDQNLGLFTIDDFNRDGMLDLIFPIIKTGSVFIAHNILDLEYDWSADYCATHRNHNLTNIPVIFDELKVIETKVS